MTDALTGMMWAQCVEGLSGAVCAAGAASTHNWQAALDLADGSAHAGYTDWHLSNIKELLSIVEQRCRNPSINLAVFPNTPFEGFWSASPTIFQHEYDFDWLYAWSVDFGAGGSSYPDRIVMERVRLVRAGQ